ncbi:unnamed protein product, partial [Owenia fusiformis]
YKYLTYHHVLKFTNKDDVNYFCALSWYTEIDDVVHIKIMAVDLKQNQKSLLDAWKDVSDTNTDTNWAVFGYEGKTNVVKLVETGDNDLDDMVEELSSGKIMYAYCRVKDPNTGLFKFVLVNWQGEGAPDSRKGQCAPHFRDVQTLLRVCQ